MYKLNNGIDALILIKNVCCCLLHFEHNLVDIWPGSKFYGSGLDRKTNFIEYCIRIDIILH